MLLYGMDGYVDKVKILLDRGADEKVRNGSWDMTAAEWAKKYGR